MATSNILLPLHDEMQFKLMRGERPNRICFATTHRNALKPNSPAFAHLRPLNFGVPFKNGVVFEFFRCTGIVLNQNKQAYWTGLTEAEGAEVRHWIAAQGTRVYLKDFFDCSIALGERTVDNSETELGALFSNAKYRADSDAIDTISRRVRRTIQDMRSFSGPIVLSCPPPRPDKEWDLPTTIGERVAKKLGVEFMELGEWLGDKGQMKDVAADQKWAALAAAGFKVNSRVARTSKRLILIDDIYQSGTTLNFLRSSLTAAGVERVSAISIVKAQRDSDNQ